MAKLEAVLFDLDGVIVDTMNLHIRATDSVFSELGVRFPREKVKGMKAMRTYDVYRAALPHMSDAEILALEDKKYSRLKKLSESLETYPGFLDFLSGLSGLKTGVVSNSRRDFIDYIISKIPGKWKFDVIVAADDIANGKPDPECYLKAASMLGVSPENCLVIEDTVTGVAAAKGAGMKVVAVTHTQDRIFLLDADLIVDSFKGLSLAKARGLFRA